MKMLHFDKMVPFIFFLLFLKCVASFMSVYLLSKRVIPVIPSFQVLSVFF